jgi:hypothetical protein
MCCVCCVCVCVKIQKIGQLTLLNDNMKFWNWLKFSFLVAFGAEMIDHIIQISGLSPKSMLSPTGLFMSIMRCSFTLHDSLHLIVCFVH